MNRGDILKLIKGLAIGFVTGAGMTYLIVKDKRNLLPKVEVIKEKEKVKAPDPVVINVDIPDELVNKDDHKVKQPKIDKNSPQYRYKELIDKLIENDFFGKEDISIGELAIKETLSNDEEYILLKFNKNSSEFIIRISDIIRRDGKNDDIMENIREIIANVSEKTHNDKVFSLIKDLSMKPYKNGYKSLKGLDMVSVLRLISVKLYNVDSAFLEEMIILFNPRGGEIEDSEIRISPVCIVNPDIKVECKGDGIFKFEDESEGEE